MDSFINLGFERSADRRIEEPLEFMSIGRNILESEDLTDVTYRVFLMMLADLYVGQPGHMYQGFGRELGHLLVEGAYLPCVERVSYTRQIDRRNDGLPDHAAVIYIHPKSNACDIEQVRRIDRFPRDILPLHPGIPYRHLTYHRHSSRNRGGRRVDLNVKDSLHAIDGYFTVTDDRIVHALTPYRTTKASVFNAVQVLLSAAVFNIFADRRNLWQVRTTEHIIECAETPLTLGVAEEHVKSLFYARELPLTESGRRRPIQHWVRAHERRVRSGIDVDVRRHLRGITAFEMHGLKFAIASPDRNAPGAEATR